MPSRDMVMRAYQNPAALTPSDVRVLQPILGNHTLQRLLAERHEATAQPMAERAMRVSERPKRESLLQRFFVTDPKKDGLTVDTTVNELVKDKAGKKYNFERTPRKGVGLRVSDDSQMAVPNINQTKDFYASKSKAQEVVDLVDAQNSLVAFEPTGAAIDVPGNDKPLFGMKPVRRDGEAHTIAKHLGNAAAFIDTCSEMAFRLSSGTGAPQSINTVIKGKSVKIDDYKSPMNRGDEFRGKFPAKDAEELGINEFATPEAGDMLTTLNLRDRPNFEDFEYHFAGAIAKSGADYVTLENFNRVGEADLGLRELFDELIKLEEHKNRYEDLLKRMRREYEENYEKSGYSPEELKKQREVDEPRILAGAQNQFWAAIASAKEGEATVTSNLRDSLTKNALWYFQMYGPPTKEVEVEATVKNDKGVPTTVTKTINQSFHAHMQATDDFGEALTLRIEGTDLAPPETTEGIDGKVSNIVEPVVESGFGTSLWGMVPSMTAAAKKADELRATVGEWTKAGAKSTYMLDKLEDELNAAGDGQSRRETAYMLKVLRIEPVLTSKVSEIEQRVRAFAALDLKSLMRNAKKFPRQRKAVQSILETKVLANFERDVIGYVRIVKDTLAQTAYRKLFPKEHANRLSEAKDKMVKAMVDLDKTVSSIQVDLSTI